MDIIRKIKELLARTGLSDNEIHFYLAALKNPQKSIYAISKELKIPKDRAYQIADSLEDKKLISKKSGKIYANPVKRFSENIRSTSRKLQRTADSLQELDPFLPFYGISNDEETFKTFKHEQSGEQFLDLSYLRWNQIHAYGDFENLIEAITEHVDQHFVRNRVKRGKKCFPVMANPKDYTFNKVVKMDVKENRVTGIVYDESLKNLFVAILPELNMTTVWQRQDNDRFSGAIFNSPTITKMHMGIYEHFLKLSEEHKFRKISEMKARGITV